MRATTRTKKDDDPRPPGHNPGGGWDGVFEGDHAASAQAGTAAIEKCVGSAALLLRGERHEERSAPVRAGAALTRTYPIQAAPLRKPQGTVLCSARPAPEAPGQREGERRVRVRASGSRGTQPCVQARAPSNE